MKLNAHYICILHYHETRRWPLLASCRNTVDAIASVSNRTGSAAEEGLLSRVVACHALIARSLGAGVPLTKAAVPFEARRTGSAHGSIVRVPAFDPREAGRRVIPALGPFYPACFTLL